MPLLTVRPANIYQYGRLVYCFFDRHLMVMRCRNAFGQHLLLWRTVGIGQNDLLNANMARQGWDGSPAAFLFDTVLYIFSLPPIVDISSLKESRRPC